MLKNDHDEKLDAYPAQLCKGQFYKGVTGVFAMQLWSNRKCRY
jgi:hypothetical protein